jgi:hypothetical protein
VKRVIFPEGNRRDYEEVAADLKEGITPHFVSTYDEVFELALGSKSEAEPAAAAEAGNEKEGAGGAGGAAAAAASAAGWGWAPWGRR